MKTGLLKLLLFHVPYIKYKNSNSKHSSVLIIPPYSTRCFSPLELEAFALQIGRVWQ